MSVIPPSQSIRCFHNCPSAITLLLSYRAASSGLAACPKVRRGRDHAISSKVKPYCALMTFVLLGRNVAWCNLAIGRSVEVTPCCLQAPPDGADIRRPARLLLSVPTPLRGAAPAEAAAHSAAGRDCSTRCTAAQFRLAGPCGPHAPASVSVIAHISSSRNVGAPHQAHNEGRWEVLTWIYGYRRVVVSVVLKTCEALNIRRQLCTQGTSVCTGHPQMHRAPGWFVREQHKNWQTEDAVCWKATSVESIYHT